MFTSLSGQGVAIRRVSRIAFGSVLIAGALALCESALWERGNGLKIIAGSWAAAFATALLVRLRGWHEPDSDRFGVAGLVVPIVGISLMGPLTLHAPVILWLETAQAFEEWVQISLVITGFAHLIFAALSARRAADLVRDRPAVKLGTIFWITVLASCVPGLIFFAIPPIVVAVTAALLLPVLHAMRGIAEGEKIALLGVNPELAFAIVRKA